MPTSGDLWESLQNLSAYHSTLYRANGSASFANESFYAGTVPNPASLVEIVLVSVVAAILSVITAGGNLLVIVSFHTDVQLQTVTNYFLVSLSVADLAIGLVSMPLFSVYLLTRRWPFGSIVCDVWLAMDYTMSNASVANLLVITFDRYFSVTRPLSYRAKRTPQKAVAMIIVAWLISFFLWTPWIFAWPYIEGDRKVPEDECFIQFLVTNSYLTIGTAIAAFYIPVTIMITIFSLIYRETEKRQKDLVQLRAGGGTAETSKTTTSGSDGCASQPEKTNVLQRVRQMFRRRRLARNSTRRCQFLRSKNGASFSNRSGKDSIRGSVRDGSPCGHRTMNISSSSSSFSCRRLLHDMTFESPINGCGLCKRSREAGVQAESNTAFTSMAGLSPDDPVMNICSEEVVDPVDLTQTKVARHPTSGNIDAEPEMKEKEDETMERVKVIATMWKRPKVGVSLIEELAKDGGSKPSLEDGKESPVAAAVSMQRIVMQARVAAKLRRTVQHHRAKKQHQEKKAAKTLSAILLAFVLTWTPYNVFIIVKAFCSDCIHPTLYDIGYWLCYINSTINPVCYALCSANFRQTYWHLLTCGWFSKNKRGTTVVKHAPKLTR